jgi:hypothetical protein
VQIPEKDCSSSYGIKQERHKPPTASPALRREERRKHYQTEAKKHQPRNAKQHEHDAQCPERRMNHQLNAGMFHTLYDAERPR